MKKVLFRFITLLLLGLSTNSVDCMIKKPASSLGTEKQADARGLFGRTPLMRALCSPPYEFQLIKELVEQGEDFTLADDSAQTVFFYAVSYDGRIEVIKFLFEKLIEARVVNEVVFLRDIWQECPTDLIECMVRPLFVVPDVNTPNSDDITPLMSAAAHGNFEAVAFLLDKGAAVSVKNIKFDGSIEDALSLAERGKHLMLTIKKCFPPDRHSQKCTNKLAAYDTVIKLLKDAMAAEDTPIK